MARTYITTRKRPVRAETVLFKLQYIVGLEKQLTARVEEIRKRIGKI